MHITTNAYAPARARLASAIASVVITTALLGSVVAGFDVEASAGALSAARTSATVTAQTTFPNAR